MLRLLIPLLLCAAAFALPAASARDPCDVVDCPRPILVVEKDRACAGVAFHVGGYAACWHAQRPTCVTQHFGHAYSETCVPPDGFWGAPLLA